MSTPAPLKVLVAPGFLTEDERNSAVWKSVRVRLQDMLARKRIDNDNPKLDRDSTLVLRGHIELLKAFIALGNEPPPTVASGARLRPRVDLGAKYG